MKIKKSKMYLFKSILEKDSALIVLDDVLGFLDRDDYEITDGSLLEFKDMEEYASKCPCYIKISEKCEEYEKEEVLILTIPQWRKIYD